MIEASMQAEETFNQSSDELKVAICRSKTLKEYYIRNREKILEYQKKYRENNKEKIRKKNNSCRSKEYHKNYHANNKEKILERSKKYRENNVEKIKGY